MVQRERLVRRIGLTLEDLAPLTLLSAPLGYGKSELLSQWRDAFDDTQARVVQVSAPKSGSLDDFWWRLAQAVGVSPAGQTAQAAVHQALLKSDRQSVLVIDDYQRVSSELMDDSLVHLVSRIAHLRLVVAARYTASLEDPFVGAAVATNVIGVGDLEFTGQERSGGGWPLRFLEPSERSQIIEADLATLEDAKAQMLLRAVAATGRTSADLVAEHFWIPQTELPRVLQAVGVAVGLGVEQSQSGVQISLPAEVAGALVSECGPLRGDSDFERFLAAHAMQIAEESPERALDINLEIGNLAGAEEVAGMHFSPHILGVPQSSALEDCSLESLRDYPILLGVRFLRDWSTGSIPRDSVRERAKQIASGPLENDGSTPLVLEVLRLLAFRVSGQWSEAKEAATKLERRLAQHTLIDSFDRELQASRVHSSLALTGVLSGDFPLAERTASRALEIAEQGGHLDEAVRAHNLLGLVSAFRRDFQSARTHLQSAEALVDSGRAVSPDWSFVNKVVAEGILANQSGDYARAAAAVRELHGPADQGEYWSLATWGSSVATARSRGPEAAFVELQLQMLHHPKLDRLSPFHLTSLQGHLASLAASAGRLAAARELLARIPGGSILVDAARVRTELFAGDVGAALEAFDVAKVHRPDGVLHPDLFLAGAVAAHGAGEHERASSLLSAARRGSTDAEFQYFLRTVPYALVLELAEHASELGGEDILGFVQSIPEDQRAHAAPTLSDHELTMLRILKMPGPLSEIAGKLRISESAAKARRAGLYRKLRVSSREEAVDKARELGLED